MVKRANIEDLEAITDLALSLWENHQYEDMKATMEKVILDERAVVFMYLDSYKAIAFAQCQLRYDYVEGTKTSPVGYLEGIYVDKEYQRKGIARKLLLECENWAKEQNCLEFGSDCELDNYDSFNFHKKMGFVEANRIIHFKKML